MTPPIYDPNTAVPTRRYKRWHRKQPCGRKREIRRLLAKVGEIKSNQIKWLNDALWELKPNSYRIYFGAIGDIIYLLDGGTKDLQEKQIPGMMEKWKEQQAQLPSG